MSGGLWEDGRWRLLWRSAADVAAAGAGSGSSNIVATVRPWLSGGWKSRDDNRKWLLEQAEKFCLQGKLNMESCKTVCPGCGTWSE